MVSAALLIQARRTAGLSQRALAARAGVPQQEIARYERGRVTPSLERLRALIAACGLELTFALTRADDSYDQQIADAVARPAAERLELALADAQSLRAVAVRGSKSRRRLSPADPTGVLRALNGAGVRYVLIGELAEVLHGSPLVPLTDTVTIIARAGEGEHLSAVITAGDRRRATAPSSPSIDAPSTFAVGAYGAELTVAPAPPGTHGYEDLRRDATEIELDEDLRVPVASLVDLVRIAEASGDRARVPALRRTLELSSASPLTHAA